MPYYSGSANSSADLRQAIVNGATAHGWTWDGANNVLYKGSVYGRLTINGQRLYVQAAHGYSGGTLINGAPKAVGISDQITGSGNVPLSYPLNYHLFIHDSPDDVICAVNYNSVWWQWLAFGQARNLGVNGSCLFNFGTLASDALSFSYGIGASADEGNTGGGGAAYSHGSGLPFWRALVNQSTRTNSAIHLDIDGVGWVEGPPDTLPATWARLNPYVGEVISKTPNAWNAEAVLARAIVHVTRPSSLLSPAAELSHLRFTRNDYIMDGEVISIGGEQWKVMPAYRKNTANRNGAGPAPDTLSHSGTIAIAVRYDA